MKERQNPPRKKVKMKLSTATELLSKAGIDDARFEARVLFREIARATDSELYGRDCESDSAELTRAVERRIKREPLQYILGEVNFYKERYKVTPDTLIPRSDTEILVEEAIKRLPDGARFIDICTGSGCIALSVLNNTKNTSAIALDISARALAVARENAERLSLSGRVEFIEADALGQAIDGKFSAVISNPPYVTEKAYENLMPEIYFEPKIAFVGGEDGLVFYKKILSLYENSLEEDGFFAFEIGYDQADALVDMANGYSMKSEIIKDYSGNPRVAILKK